MKRQLIPIMAIAFMCVSLHANAQVAAQSAPTATPSAAIAPTTGTATAPAQPATTPATTTQPATSPAAAPAQPAKFGFGRFISSKAATASAPPAGQAVVLIRLVTLATDQGMQAMDLMASIFPPEKVAKFEESSKKYHELKANRKDGNIDADQCQVATDAAEEFAKLDVDWNSYRKEKATVVPLADKRLAYMLLADGLAVTQLPGTVVSVQSDVTSMMSNPFQIGKARQLGVTVVLLNAVSKQMPKQVDAFKTVRGIVKKIAVAENMTLAPDPAANLMKDPVTAAATIDKELPPEPVAAEPTSTTAASPTPTTPAVSSPATAPITPSAVAAPTATTGGGSSI